MQDALLIAAGIALALPYVWFATRPRVSRFLIGGGLVVAALIYVGFAVFGGADARWLGVEVAGVALYGAFVALGYRLGARWLAAGWGAHVAWDVLLHEQGPGAAYTPHWYPEVCLGFDVAVALAVVVALSASGTRDPAS